jgi:hypothetical protein
VLAISLKGAVGIVAIVQTDIGLSGGPPTSPILLFDNNVEQLQV